MRVTTSATLSPTGSASAALPATSPAPFASALLGLVDTLAGAGASGLINAVGTVARFSAPQGLAVDWFSNVYVADSGNNVVRVVVASTRAVSTLAGGGASGSLGGQADGAGSNALFLAPGYVAVDVAGQLYVSDVGNGCVRRVAVSSGLTTTFVGGGASGFATGFADGTGTNALFNGPMQLALDPSSFTLYLVDAYSHAVRVVDIASRVVTTLAGGGGAVLGASGYADGAGAAALFNFPQGIAVDPSGSTLVVAEVGNSLLRTVDIRSGLVATLASGLDFDAVDGAPLFAPCALAVDARGTFYVASGGSSTVLTVSLATGATATLAGSATRVSGFADGAGAGTALFSGPGGLALDPVTTELLVGDTVNNAVRRIGGVRPTASASPSAAASYSQSSTATGSRSAAPTATTICCVPGTAGTMSLNAAAGASWRVAGGSGGYLLLQFATVASGALSCCAGCGSCAGTFGCWGCAVVGGSSAQYKLQVPVSQGDTVKAAPSGAQVVTLLGSCACGGVSAPSLVQATSLASVTASATLSRSVSATVSASLTSSASGAPTPSSAPSLTVLPHALSLAVALASKCVVSTLAGDPTMSGVTDGTGTNARFWGLSGLSTDYDERFLYAADQTNNEVRAVEIATGAVTTIAGSGAVGVADGTGTSAQLQSAQS